jgi:hypothetical protein
VAIDPGKCKGWEGDFRCVEDLVVESVEGEIGPFLQFSRWESVTGERGMRTESRELAAGMDRNSGMEADLERMVT